jgi:hypothetical protein
MEERVTDGSTPSPNDAPQLVDRVLVEMARRRALAEALRPPKRRPQTAPGAPRAKLPERRAS